VPHDIILDSLKEQIKWHFRHSQMLRGVYWSLPFRLLDRL